MEGQYEKLESHFHNPSNAYWNTTPDLSLRGYPLFGDNGPFETSRAFQQFIDHDTPLKKLAVSLTCIRFKVVEPVENEGIPQYGKAIATRGFLCCIVVFP